MKKTNNLPKYVQPYRDGKYRVYIVNRSIRHVKSGFDTPSEAHRHAMSVLAGEVDETADTGRTRHQRIPDAKPQDMWECHECGYSQVDEFSRCQKCNSCSIVFQPGLIDPDTCLQNHLPVEKKSSRGCDTCIHAVVCCIRLSPGRKAVDGTDCEFYRGKGTV